VPTTRPRHTITESDELARALDDAARRWPEHRDSRSKLLLRLIGEGHRAVQGTERSEAAGRRNGVLQTSGALTGAYGGGYLERLREEWPD
jgi:hypothetical protein